jgi:hypothetical protein
VALVRRVGRSLDGISTLLQRAMRARTWMSRVLGRVLVVLLIVGVFVPVATFALRKPECFENVNCSWTYYVHDTGDHPFATGECFKGFCKCKGGNVGQYCQHLKPAPSFSCTTQNKCKNKFGVGRASEIRGGNLTISIVAAKNLPDLDEFGAAGGETDAFIRVKVGRYTRDSQNVRNSLNPVWPTGGSNVSVGIQLSGTPIIIEVWDKDSGLEFGNDLIANVTDHVIPCSFLDSVNNIGAGAISSITEWNNPYSKRVMQSNACQESAWIPLVKDQPPDYCSNETKYPTAMCIHVRQTIEAFALKIDKVHTTAVDPSTGKTTARVIGFTAAGVYDPNVYKYPWGRAYFDNENTYDGKYFRFENATGGISVMVHAADRNIKQKEYFEMSWNYPMEMYVFREQEDFEKRPLEWLEGAGFEQTRVYSQFVGAQGSDDDMRAVKRAFDNPLGGSFTFGGNSFKYEKGEMNKMYSVVVKMLPGNPPPPYKYAKDFDREKFWSNIWQFGVIGAILLGLVLRFVGGELNFRLDRIEAWLCRLSVEGDDRTILAGLFLCYDGDDPDDDSDDGPNAEFCRHLYWAKRAVYVIVALPVLQIFVFGIVLVGTVQPLTLGFSLLFVGYPAIICFVCMHLWQKQGWRMSRFILGALILCLTLLFLFVCMAPFIDPGVLIEGGYLDLFSITCVFMTLNLLPTMAIAVINDTALSASFKQLAATINETKDDIERPESPTRKNRGSHKRKKKELKEPEPSILDFLGDDYSIDPSCPAFAYADPLSSGIAGEKKTRRNRTIKLYLLGILLLVVFSLIVESYADPKHRTFGWETTGWIIVTDIAWWLRVRRGTCKWGPGKTVVLQALYRIALTAFCGEQSLAGVSLAYLVFGIALAQDIVNTRLKTLTPIEVGAIAFFGDKKSEAEKVKEWDVQAWPEFVLFYLSFTFLCVLIASSANPEATMIQVLNTEWRIWIIGLFAITTVLMVTLVGTTTRAFMLMMQKLMHSHMYFSSKNFRLPNMLALLTYFMALSAAVLLSWLTGSYFLLMSAIYVPVIFGFGGRMYAVWVMEDYDLMPSWHRRELRVPQDEEGGDDAIGEENPQSSRGSKKKNIVAKVGLGTGGTFSLPPLKKSGPGGGTVSIQMPSLPMQTPWKTAEGKSRHDVSPSKSTTFRDATGTEEDEVETPVLLRKFLWDRELLPFKDPLAMTGMEAFLKGKLRADCYYNLTIFLMFLAVVYCYGNIVTIWEVPSYAGTVLWTGTWVIVFTVAPLIKYFQRYRWTSDMIASEIFGHTVLFLSCLGGFLDYLEGDVNSVWSLMLLCILLGWPTLLGFGWAVFNWREHGWSDDFVDEWTDPVVIVFCITTFMIAWFNFVVYAWIDVYMGAALTMILSASAAGFFCIRDWANNDFWLSPKYAKACMLTLKFGGIFFVAMAVFFDVQIIFFVSVGFILLIFKLVSSAIGWSIQRPPFAPLYVSPYVFPIFMYDPNRNSISEESRIGFYMYGALGSALLWGVFAICFINPLGFGVAITSTCLIAIVALTLNLISLTPRYLGEATRCVDGHLLQFAANEAIQEFKRRRSKISLRSEKWIELDAQEERENAILNKYKIRTAKEKVKESTDEPGRMSAMKAFQNIRKAIRSLSYVDKEHYKKKLRRHDAPFLLKDALLDELEIGEGPIGWFCGFGRVKRHSKVALLKAYEKALELKEKGHERLKDLKKKLDEKRKKKGVTAEHENAEPGDDAKAASSEEETDSEWESDSASGEEDNGNLLLPSAPAMELLASLEKLDNSLDKEYGEEMRMIVHFQLLIIVASHSRIQKESVEFQMFLRENRFKLMANGCAPPPEIFKSNSFANIDMTLVANWLVRITPEQHERFNQLKKRFNKEIAERDLIKDMEDDQLREDEEQLYQMRSQQDWVRGQEFAQEILSRRQYRQEMQIELEPGIPEDIQNGKAKLEEIARGEHGGCAPGRFGRASQWTDAEFPPSASSIGHCSSAALVKGWSVAKGINPETALFVGGTDPDDVHQGVLHDAWLLSAIQILSASGGVGDDEVDELIANIFIQLQDTPVGAYGVRFFKNGQWETVFVDDHFPMLSEEYKEGKCAGAAFAYTDNFEETWVAVVEKAYAKYYGSYAALEHGFCHFALQDLTGGEGEAISISQASRGSQKELFWAKLLNYRHNGFLLGAGSVSEDGSDKELQETGLVMGAIYTVLKVVQCENYRLLKLRNPPGDHGEWQGDWSDNWPGWNARLKMKLEVVDDEDDGCFFMAFDDFCLAFRTLYLCRYYDPNVWKEYTFHEYWRNVDGTSQGLPTKHNPKCKLDENPQFALAINRPTDVSILLSQTDNGVAIGEPLEAAFYVVKTPKHLPNRSVRVTELTMSNVVAWSGEPCVERNLTVMTHLMPGTYTILCAVYKGGEEGPFTLTIRTNFSAQTSQLWPPQWKKEGKDGPEKTFKEKMMEKAAAAAELAAEKAAAASEKAKKKIQAKLAENFDGIKSPEEEERERLRAERKAREEEDSDDEKIVKKKAKWKKKTDSSGKVFYYNRETQMSMWDVPDDYDGK